MWARYCVSGLLHDFAVFQGKGGTVRPKEMSKLCVGGDVMVKLCDSVKHKFAEKVDFMFFGGQFLYLHRTY